MSRHKSVLKVLTVPIIVLAAAHAAGATDADEPWTGPLPAPACRSSPFEPLDENDQTFVVDCGNHLDTGCTFRSDVPNGRLVFAITIDRYIGVVDQNNKLLNVNALIAQNIISRFATLSMPAFDVDFNGGAPPERDRVWFNGEKVSSFPGTQNPEFLQGDNDIWRLNSFRIPVSKIRFPALANNGQGPPVPVDNVIEIEIDTATPPGQDRWCTAIDWALLNFQASRPVLMVHGIFSSGATWSPKWTGPGGELTVRKLPHDTIDMGDLDSIGNNAVKIANKVVALRNRWGVDKINIVAHSKGGIDSRHYLTNQGGAARVEKLLQIGTPNAGSPLADMAAGLLPKISAHVALFKGPGGLQLTTPYMRRYNRTHRAARGIIYVSLAGDYRFGGWGIWDAALRGIMGGPSDTIVPVSSVHALPYAAHMTVFSVGADKQTMHTGLPSSNATFARLRPHVFNFSDKRRSSGSWLTQTQPDPVEANHTEVLAGLVGQNETEIHALDVETTSSLFLMLMYGLGDLDLVVVTPSGMRINPQVADTLQDVDFFTAETLDSFRYEGYTIADPEAGTWSLEVTGTDVVTAGGEGYILTGWLGDTSITFSVGLDKDFYLNNDDIIISATAMNEGEPIIGATVTAQTLLPDLATVVPLTLFDDGNHSDVGAADGVYANVFDQTSDNGEYTIRVVGVGPAGSPFSREGELLTTISAGSSSIAGPHSSNGVDDDGDGLYNRLDAIVGLDIDIPGIYRLAGDLYGPDGAEIGTALAQENLSIGAQAVILSFNGFEIFSSGIDGPYSLTNVVLAEIHGEMIAEVDEETDLHTTADFAYRDFQHPDVFLNGMDSDQGIDLDSDGDFDILRLGLGVEVRTAGNYEYSVRLVDQCHTELGFLAAQQWLSTGGDWLVLDFDGALIGVNGVDGPHSVKDLLLFGAGGSLVAPTVTDTQAYPAGDFDSFTPAPDCNDNGVPDACEIGDATSDDCNVNGIPDECEPDCNDNNISDDCDIASGTSQDDNGNGIPDDCEGACCLRDSTCLVLTATDCASTEGTYQGADTKCLGQDSDGNGIDDACDVSVPTVSEWGLAIMTLLLLTGLKVKFGWRGYRQQRTKTL